jgi:uncharacterized protein (TIGR02145 family)
MNNKNKILILNVIITLFTLSLKAQQNDYFNYQTIIRDNNGVIYTSKNVSLQINLMQGSETGNVEYRERHYIQTNQFGLVNLKIGNGEEIIGSFSEIDWSLGNYFLQVEIDIEGGTEFEIIGTSKLLSVPYALYAKNVLNKNDADADPSNEIQVISISNDTIFLEDGGFVKLPEQPIDNDLDATNEIQIITLSNDTIFLENGGHVKLPVDKVDDADADSENELQVLTISNDTIFLENGGFVKLPFDDVEDADANSTNEIQTISINADTIFLEKGGYIILPEDEFEDADADPENELQEFIVSETNDTLYISNGNFVIIPGISAANHSQVSETTVTDFDGNEYKIVQIGDQIWMKENLRTTKYNDGASIPLITNNTTWSNLTSPGFCWYNNDIAEANPYGALYNWYVINTEKICPSGWHVPSLNEKNILLNNVDNGGDLKDTGTMHWSSPNTGATNNSGFTALPSGQRSYAGTYYDLSFYAVFWLSTNYITNKAYYWGLGYSDNTIYGGTNEKKYGLSIRCIKD